MKTTTKTIPPIHLAAAEDLRAGARALKDLAYTHKCWMHEEEQQS